MSKIVGVDMGNDTIKIVCSPNEQFRIKNAVSKRMLTEVRKNLSFGKEKVNIMDDLDVTIQSKNLHGRYFVGSLATQIGEDETKTGTRKLKNDTLIVPVVTLLALSIKGESKEAHFKQVSGLPINEFSTDKEAFAEKIQGTYQVTFNTGELKGRTVYVHIDRVELVPEGVAVVINQMFNETGTQIRDTSLQHDPVGVIDIGAFTTDLPIVVKGKPNSQVSDGLEEGIANYLDHIVEFVKQTYQVKMTRSQLVSKLEENDLSLSMKGEMVDLQPYIHEQFTFFAEKIASVVDKMWEKNYEIRRFYAVGGGAKALRTYLEKTMKARNIKVTFIEDEDPQMQNALGYWKVGRNLFELTGVAHG